MLLTTPSGRARPANCYEAGAVDTYRGVAHIRNMRDVRYVLENPDRFSSDASSRRGGRYPSAFDGYWATAGTEHDELKGITHWLFRQWLGTLATEVPRLVAVQAVEIAEFGSRRFDYGRDLVYPVTLDMVWTFVGLPFDSIELLLPELLTYEKFSLEGTFQPEHPRVRAYLREKIEERWSELQENPRQSRDVLDAVAIAYGKKRITIERATGFFWMFLAAAHGTLGALTCNVFGLVHEFGYLQTVLNNVATPGNLRGLVSEPNRLIAPFAHSPRWVSQRASLPSGAQVGPGEVLVCYSAANRDESVFPDPHSFDPDRPNLGQHVGFGWSTHRCTGENVSNVTAALITVTAHDLFVGLRWDQPKGWERNVGVVDGSDMAPAIFDPTKTRAVLKRRGFMQ